MWRLWCKALGEKDGKTDSESDKIAIIRTVIIISYFITNCFISCNKITFIILASKISLIIAISFYTA